MFIFRKSLFSIVRPVLVNVEAGVEAEEEVVVEAVVEAAVAAVEAVEVTTIKVERVVALRLDLRHSLSRLICQMPHCD